MVEGQFRDRWLEMRGEAIRRIAAEIRRAQADGATALASIRC